MYRYSVDNAITYTSEDFVLFKESPFACWMERLTLENRDHGIPPDVDSDAPHDTIDTQDDLADTLRAEGKNVILIEPDLEESVRRSSTLDAMRKGVDFIVNGQLALGALSGSANLLMRTSGYSELGNYLYVPCSTQKKTSAHSALRLCFLADLLHSLQGQLPPQMLIIRGGSDVVPLETEDHIYHYRAVKHRFMSEQQAFRKHKMPDPAASANFGRWSECANEVLKQRALRNPEEPGSDESSIEAELSAGLAGSGQEGDPQGYVMPVTLPVPLSVPETAQATTAHPGYAAAAARLDVPIAYTPQRVMGSASAYDLDGLNREPSAVVSRSIGTSGTLVEQARKLIPESQLGSAEAGLIDDALENLAFIGSSNQVPTIGQRIVRPSQEGALRSERRALVREPTMGMPPAETIADETQPLAPEPRPRNPEPVIKKEPVIKREQVFADANASLVAPPPSLRNPGPREMVVEGLDATYTKPAMTQPDYKLPEISSPGPHEGTTLEQPVEATVSEPEIESEYPLDSTVFTRDKPSMVDMDDTMPVVDGEVAVLEEATVTTAAVEPATANSLPLPETAQQTVSARPQGPENTRLRDDAAAFTEIFSDKDTYLSDDSSVDTFNSSLITSEDDFET